jgi:hypothetical protein
MLQMESAEIYRVCVFMAFGYLQDHELTLVSWHFFCKVLEELKAGAVFRGWSSMVQKR